MGKEFKVGEAQAKKVNQSAAYQVVIPQWVPWVALSLTVALAGLIAYLVRRGESGKTKGSDIMRRRNLQFLLLLVLLIYIPQTTYAENRDHRSRNRVYKNFRHTIKKSSCECIAANNHSIAINRS